MIARSARREDKRLAAAAELDLVRIRRIRGCPLSDLALAVEAFGNHTEMDLWGLMLEGAQAGLVRQELVRYIKERQKDQPSSRVRAITLELARIERYERRAMSRRNGLLRALDALRPGDPRQ